MERGLERFAFSAFEGGGFEADSERDAVKHGRHEANAAGRYRCRKNRPLPSLKCRRRFFSATEVVVEQKRNIGGAVGSVWRGNG